MREETWGLIVAAGAGRRFGGTTAKQYRMLAGSPLLCWTLDAFQRASTIDAVQLMVAPEQAGLARDLVDACGASKVRGIGHGGSERWDTVRAGLQALPDSCRIVAIHDGARPLVSPALIDRVVARARECGAAIPSLAVRDTVKRAEGDRIAATESRRNLHLAQTPQAFELALVRAAHAATSADEPATDDAELVERLGRPVSLVPGAADNIKVTLPEDLELARRLVGGGLPRVGTGYDVHRLVPGRRLVLGGVELQHPLGLQGHSDADVLCHAVGDALLGAAGLGDLGRLFPADEPALRGVSSLALLRRIASTVAESGHRVANIDATIICQAPRLAPHMEAMRSNLAQALGVHTGQVSVKATTTEGLGFVGQGEGIAAQAAALVVSCEPEARTGV